MITSPARVACSGTLLSRSFVESIARESVPVLDAALTRAYRSLMRCSAAARGTGARTICETFSAPLAALLGFEVRGARGIVDGHASATLTCGERAAAVLFSAAFEEPLRAARSAAVTATAAAGLRWCLLTNGAELALLDASRPHARRWLVFDLRSCASDPRSLQALVALAGSHAMQSRDRGPTPFEAMIARSDADLRSACRALQSGVEGAALALTTALDRGGRPRPLEPLFEQSLTVVYRILFLRFAESRGLVPVWHPTYRRAYTIESLREAVEEQRDPRGIWEALQAIARLAHRGATAGELSVVPFNGRLFSPAHAPAVAGASVPDAAAATVVSALTSIPSAHGGRKTIAYADLDVEQLGSIYERVLEFTPARDPKARAAVLRRGDARKTTASFYTPRTLTEFIVRRTLEPLTAHATPEEILNLRVLDPAMGSGAFLVAACRELAGAYQHALIRSGECRADEWTPADRAGFRRLVAQRCLYGVDLNPMAVQLSRLSLWLCSLAADKPLTFLDHRLRIGNSVLGASPGDVTRRAPGGGPAREATLFAEDALEAIGRACKIRLALAAIPDDSVTQVREKEALLSRLESDGSPVGTWRRLCDLWCACWFWPEPSRAPDAREFGALYDSLKGGCLPARALGERLQVAARIADEHHFFHWQLEFPEVLVRGGFDAVVGNPPWDMMRGAAAARRALRFSRDSGTFRLQSTGHSNLYQLFLERFLQLSRPGGRVGLVLPWGIATDEGSAALRRSLLEGCALDDFVVLDNRHGIFPIHRALKFCAVSLEKRGRSEALAYRAAISDVGDLDRPTGRELAPARDRIELSRALLEALSGSSLAVPYVGSREEVRILERLTAAAAPAASPDGWHLQFGRELNASDDRTLFSNGGHGYPVISGRHIDPFRVRTQASALRIPADRARRRLGAAVLRPRLAYRDVAGAGNRVTLIAAVVPPHVVTTHTLFCLRTRLSADEQLFLCAILNSYVANYLVRTRVGTHVTTALVHSLPVPRPPRGSACFTQVVSLASRGASPALHAAVASLYGLEAREFERILETFPLVPVQEREAAMAAFVRGREV